MKKYVYLAFLFILLVPRAQDQLKYLGSFDLRDAAEIEKAVDMIRTDPKLIHIVASRIRFDTPPEELIRFIFLLSLEKYPASYFPVKLIFDAEPDEVLFAACVNYFVSMNTDASKGLLLDYLNEKEKYTDTWYLSAFKLVKEGFEPNKIFPLLFMEGCDKYRSASVLCLAPDTFKKDMIDLFISQEDHFEASAYALYMIATRLTEKELRTLFAKCRRDQGKLFLLFSVFEKSGEIEAVQFLRKSAKKGALKKEASEKLGEIKKILEVDWVKKKIFKPQGDTAALKTMIDGIGTDQELYDYAKLTEFAGAGDIGELQRLQTLLPDIFSSKGLKRIDEINNLIFILKASGDLSYFLEL